jgi:hypothetical protein
MESPRFTFCEPRKDKIAAVEAQKLFKTNKPMAILRKKGEIYFNPR